MAELWEKIDGRLVKINTNYQNFVTPCWATPQSFQYCIICSPMAFCRCLYSLASAKSCLLWVGSSTKYGTSTTPTTPEQNLVISNNTAPSTSHLRNSNQSTRKKENRYYLLKLSSVPYFLISEFSTLVTRMEYQVFGLMMCWKFKYLHSSPCLWPNFLVHFDESGTVVYKHAVLISTLQVNTKDEIQRLRVFKRSVK